MIEADRGRASFAQASAASLPAARILCAPSQDMTASVPLQNRVDPWGRLIADRARGSLMGNRGVLHDADQQIRKSHALKRWIICQLEFKGRRRQIMQPGQYTELFFLDEATALAAGHRPCAECQRERFNEFRTAWTAGGTDSETRDKPIGAEDARCIAPH